MTKSYKIIKEFHYGAYKKEEETVDKDGNTHIKVYWERPKLDQEAMTRDLLGLEIPCNFTDDMVERIVIK